MASLPRHLDLERCPHCSVNTPSISLRDSFETRATNEDQVRLWGVYVCHRCGGVVTAYSWDWANYVNETFPETKTIHDAIPDPANSYLSQAIESLHAPSGSIMLSASGVDAMLKKKGLTDGTLNSRINKAAQEHLITEEMAQWAHAVRLDANAQRHADLDVGLPSTEDAQHTLEFALALAQFLFVLPARIKKGLDEAQQTE